LLRILLNREAPASTQRSAISQRSRVLSEHKSFTSAAKKLGADIGFEYSDIFNGTLGRGWSLTFIYINRYVRKLDDYGYRCRVGANPCIVFRRYV